MAVRAKQSLRAAREKELVAATRALFDERGVQDAPIEEIARSVGIARGLIYRSFASKDELYVATVVDYLDELTEVLRSAVNSDDDPTDRLEALTRAYAGYCIRYPAFLDSSLALMRGPAGDLEAAVSEAVWLRLGRTMARSIDQLAAVIRDGVASGDFEVADPDYTANVLWTQGLGVMHLARIGVGVHKAGPAGPGLFAIDPDRVIDTCVEVALGLVVVDR